MAWKNEAEAREQIKTMVAEYYHDFKEKKTPYQEGCLLYTSPSPRDTR